MGKSKAPPAPNYAPIIQAQTDAANRSNQLSDEQLAFQREQLARSDAQFDWAKTQYAQDRAANAPIIQNMLDRAQEAENYSQQDRARWIGTYQPVEDAYISHAGDYDQYSAKFNDRADKFFDRSDQDYARYDSTFVPVENDYIEAIRRLTDKAQIEQRAGEAASDVSQQFTIGRGNATRQLEAYGIDPSQTRAAALDLGTRTQEAAARASAANVSRRQDAIQAQQERQFAIGVGQNLVGRAQSGAGMGLSALGMGQASLAMGQADRLNAINVGRGYPGQSMALSNSGYTGTQGALSGNLQTTASGANSMGTAATFGGLAGTFGGLGSGFNSAGINALAGASSSMNNQYQNQLDRYKAQQASSSGAGSILGTVLGIGTKMAGLFEDGGVVPGEGEDTAGIPVTREMSPSMGVQTDDVPARLNAGEFVMPEDAVRWFGEKSLQRMISKSREERQGAQARPRMQAVPDQRPAIDTTRGIAVSR